MTAPSRLAATFAASRAEHRSALVTYVMAGDPDRVLRPDVFKDMPQSPGLRTKLGQLSDRPVTQTPMGRDLAV